MPSIKKRVTGFIRQFSAPNGPHGGGGHGGHQGGGDKSRGKGNKSPHTMDPEGFIHKYLQSGVNHPTGPEIVSGKTGESMPLYQMHAEIDLDVFAAYTGPEGGITSISRVDAGGNGNGSGREAAEESSGREAAEESEDFDYIDLDDLRSSRRSSKVSSDKKHSDATGANSSNSAVINNKENAKPSNTRSSPRPQPRPRRELSVENDYPELGGDFFHRSSLPNTASSSSSGQHQALSQLHSNQMVNRRLKLDKRNDTESVIAGVQHWNRPNNAATGQAITLYERHPYTAEHAGNPVADTFAVVARKNSAVMVLGDGVNWGSKAALASRCAVSGCMEYLNAAIFGQRETRLSTQEVFQCLLRSFHGAHSLILQEDAQLTTLTACVIVPVEYSDDETRFAACVCNVGDSLAYVYSPGEGHVREITQDSHDITSNRDMRDALGALGPVDGRNPELSNLTYSMTFLSPGDIVFLTSDGVSDNFDPVVGKFCVPAKADGRRAANPHVLPTVQAVQRHELTLLRMEDILNHGDSNNQSSNGPAASNGVSPTASSGSGRVNNSAELCHRMVDFCQRLTTAKRKILEDPDLYPEHTRHALPDSDATRLDQKMRRRKVCEKLAMVPGKLDHATIVAYCVEDRRQSLQHFKGTCATSGASGSIGSSNGDQGSFFGALRAPCASSEDLTYRDDEEELAAKTGADSSIAVDEGTPTPSLSLCSSPSLQCGSLAVTPVHQPKQDIDLCFKGGQKK